MTDRYEKYAGQVLEISRMIGIISSMNFLINQSAGRIAEMNLTKKEKSWIEQTQGTHAKRILAEISERENELKHAG